MPATLTLQKPILHLIQKSLSVSEFDLQILRLTNQQDALVFMGDCVFDLASLDRSINQLDNLTIYVIDSDISARSLNETLSEQINIIDFDKFVSLTVDVDKVITW